MSGWGKDSAGGPGDVAAQLPLCMAVGHRAVHSLMSRGKGNELLDGLVLVCGS